MDMLKVIQNTDSSDDYLYNAILYIVNKAEAVRYDGYHVDPNNAYEQMMVVKKYFSKTSGNQLMHFVVSFDVRSVQDENVALHYGYRIAQYFGDRFQTVFSVHEKDSYYNGRLKSMYHVHFILNSVSFVDGKMFAESKGEIARFAEYIGKVTRSKNCRVIYGSEE